MPHQVLCNLSSKSGLILSMQLKFRSELFCHNLWRMLTHSIICWPVLASFFINWNDNSMIMRSWKWKLCFICVCIFCCKEKNTLVQLHVDGVKFNLNSILCVGLLNCSYFHGNNLSLQQIPILWYQLIFAHWSLLNNS